MIVFALTTVKLKRLLATDAAADIYITQQQLDAFKKDHRGASTARSWYYGMKRYGDPLPGMAPNKMVSKSVVGFVVMIGLYIGAVFLKCVDVFLSEFDGELYLIIPFVWMGVSIVILVMLFRWLHSMEITNLS